MCIRDRLRGETLFLHRISVVRVYVSIAATTQDPAGQDTHHPTTLPKSTRCHLPLPDLMHALQPSWCVVCNNSWQPWVCSRHQMMRTPTSGVHGVVDAMNKFTRTEEVLWRKRDSTATLRETVPQPLPGQAFIDF